MDEDISKKLQITSQLFVSIAIFIVVVVASLAQLYILSASLSVQLQDKAQIVARTLEIGIRESDMVELEGEIQQKLDELKKTRPDIVEVDVVIPDESTAGKYRMLASTGHSGESEPPDRPVNVASPTSNGLDESSVHAVTLNGKESPDVTSPPQKAIA